MKFSPIGSGNAAGRVGVVPADGGALTPSAITGPAQRPGALESPDLRLRVPHCYNFSRILTFFGHVSRRGDDSIERLVVQGSVKGTRPRGRSPMRWTYQIKAATKCSVCECTRKAAGRDEWRRITKSITRNDSQ
ncbi:hypothetical protein ACJJTC_012304 [Scirpophaga incertulas]